MARAALVVEDDPDIGQLLRFILEREGFEVTHLRDGRAALARVAQGDAPQLVLLDVMLPHATGHDVLAAIRAAAAWRGVPVVMLTAKSHEDDIVRALDAGANDYMVKPFQPAELKARVRRLVPPA
ncbi:MAG: response regulator transcription factor [Betaproteobacteria bacterium]|nr:response regulator transcription factor [Betaproteobacteria bacterium]PWB60533.1 MAG: two-component system response regulator [Betaproteobacteria bacterium]